MLPTAEWAPPNFTPGSQGQFLSQQYLKILNDQGLALCYFEQLFKYFLTIFDEQLHSFVGFNLQLS